MVSCVPYTLVGYLLNVVVLEQTVRDDIFRLHQCGQFDIELSEVRRGTALQGHVIKTLQSISMDDCTLECVRYINCKSINVHKSMDCQLNRRKIDDANVTIVSHPDWTYFEARKNQENVGGLCRQKKPCKVGRCEDTCSPPGFQCFCPTKFSGPTCSSFKDYAIHFESQVADATNYPKVEFFPPLGAESYTVCFWFKATSLPSRLFYNIFTLHTAKHGIVNNVCNNPILALWSDSKVKLHFGYYARAAFTVELHVWYHVCIILKDDGEGSLFLNGALHRGFQFTADLWDSEMRYRMLFGNDAEIVDSNCQITKSEYGFLGDISQAHVWKDSLTKEQVWKVYKFQDMHPSNLFKDWSQFSFTPIDGISNVTFEMEM